MNSLIYDIGLTPRHVRECIFVLRQQDVDTAEIFGATIRILSQTAQLIVQEMISLEKDLEYWRFLSESSPLHIYWNKLNSKIFRSWILGSWHHTIHRSYNWIGLSSSFKGKRAYDENEWYSEHEIEYKMSLIRSSQRELASLLAIIHEINFPLQAKCREMRRMEPVNISQGTGNDHELAFETKKLLHQSLSSLLRTLHSLKRRRVLHSEEDEIAGKSLTDASTREILLDVVKLFNNISIYSPSRDYPLQAASATTRRPSHWERNWLRNAILISGGLFLGRKLFLSIQDGSFNKAIILTVGKKIT